MTNIALIIVSLVAGFTCASAGDIIASRSFPSCGYIGERIYCWGGDTSPTFNLNPTIDEEIYSLNIKAFIGQRSEIMISQWNKMVPTIGFWIGQRRTPTSIALSDGKRLLIQGGDNPGTFKYLNQTAIYDASTNTWAKGGPYTVENVGVRQIYSATAVNLPNGLVGFYGGFEQYANIAAPEIAGNGNAVTFDSRNLSYVGFNRFITHNPDSGTWASFSPQASTLLDFYPTAQTATINPNTGKVYYLGGSYYTTSSNWAPIRTPFNWAAVFDTKSGTWSNETLGGDIPTARMYHTANLLPNSQDIILYGGSEDGQTASGSFCYTLNLETNTWTKHDTNIPEYLSGPRFSHSAVLVDSTLFILFGRGVDGALNPSLLTIDVANATHIAYTANYASNTTTNTTTNSNEPNSSKTNVTESNSNESNPNGSTPNASGGLSAGAIGGISAGSIVAGLGIIAFVFFYLRRQKKAKQQDTHEDMDVDWDKIEEHYKEVPATKSSSPQLTESPVIAENTSVRHSPVSTETSTVKNNPNIVVSIVKPSVTSVDDYTSVKPEGE
ncbi:hypothetical protein MFLAVUS_000095 [Mucor flavus]|uniref:Galactose oxidase n=1 Tax=Mucor flavus TaxID=439312 RepID=A0ABP9YIQ7_9FUNG